VILGILQARTSSTRLPGKVLRPILGAPLIVRELERVRRARRLDALVVATSTDPSDDELADVVTAHGVEVRRGSLDDALGRFLGVVDEFAPDVVVRLTGDNPMTDPGVLDRVVEEHLQHGAAYTSNAIRRTYPRGLDIEAVDPAALRQIAATDPTPDEREHVTLGVYRRAGAFPTRAVVQERDLSHLRWTVDLPADLEFATSVYGELHASRPDFRQEDVLALLERRPELVRTEADATEAAG
jgi:spore coat polysaccharide biosynthesis protein SpsF